MNSETYLRLETLFHRAREMGPAERRDFLSTIETSEPELLGPLLELLAVSAGSESDEEDGLGLGTEIHRALFAHVPTNGSPADLPEQVGPYRIIRRIGAGGMGVVYEAEQASPRRRVALKLVHSYGVMEEAHRRFLRESEILGQLDHPGIARIHEAGTFDAGSGLQPYFSMEYVEGDPLVAHAERRGLGRAERLQLLVRVCHAVQHAHERGVVHRDLKPDNILVTDLGFPKVLDFGVARLIGDEARHGTLQTREGALIGTLTHMAPEQLAGDAEATGPRSDVYALGVLAYQLLAGRLPHKVVGLSATGAIQRLLQREAPRLGRIDRSLRGDLETVVGKALARSPSERYASARALAEDLERALADVPVLARRAGPLERTWRWSRRNRMAAATIVLLAGLAAAMAFLSVLLDGRNRRITKLSTEVNGLLDASEAARRALRQELYRADMQRVTHVTFSGHGSGVSGLLDRWRPAPGEDDIRGWEWHVLRSSVASDDDLLRLRSGAGKAMDWCRATGQVAVAGGSGARILDLASRREVLRLHGFSHADHVRFNADGTRLLVAGMTKLLAMDLATGATIASRPSREQQFSGWLDAGARALVFVDGHRIWDVDGDNLTPVEGTDAVPGHLALAADGRRVAGWHRDRQLRVGDLDGAAVTWTKELETVAPDVPGTPLALSPDGTLVAAALKPGGLCVWSCASGRVLFRNRGAHLSNLSSVRWSEDGERIVTSSTDSTVKVWGSRSGALRRILRGHVRDAREATFVNGDRMIVSSDQSGDTRFHDLTRPPGHALVADRGRLSAFRSIGWAADDGEVRTFGMYGVARWSVAGSFPAPVDPLEPTWRTPSPDGSMVVEVEGRTLRILEGATGRDLMPGRAADGSELEIDLSRRRRVVWSPEGDRVHVGSAGADWVIEGLPDAPRVVPFHGSMLVMEFDLAPDGDRIAVATLDGLFVLDARTREVVGQLEPEGHDPLQTTGIVPAYGPPGSPLAFGWGPKVMLFDPVTLDFVRTLDCHSDAIQALAWSPDGRRLAASTHEGRVHVIDPEHGVAAAFDCPAMVFDLAWDSAGSRLAAVDGYGHWHLWDARASLGAD